MENRVEWVNIKQLEADLHALSQSVKQRAAELSEKYTLRPATNNDNVGKDRESSAAVVMNDIESEGLLVSGKADLESRKRQRTETHAALSVNECQQPKRRNYQNRIVRVENVLQKSLMQLAIRYFFETHYVYEGLVDELPLLERQFAVDANASLSSSQRAPLSTDATLSPLSKLFGHRKRPPVVAAADDEIGASTASASASSELSPHCAEVVGRQELLTQINHFLVSLGMKALHQKDALWSQWFLCKYLMLSPEQKQSGSAFLLHRLVPLSDFVETLTRMLKTLSGDVDH